MIGPAQVSVRVFELVFGHRYSIMRSAVFGSMMLPVGLGVALLAGDIFAGALFVVVTYGMSNGLKAVQRATLPLALFGRAQFGAYMGRLALPQGIVSAVSPPIMAAVLRQVRHADRALAHLLRCRGLAGRHDPAGPSQQGGALTIHPGWARK